MLGRRALLLMTVLLTGCGWSSPKDDAAEVPVVDAESLPTAAADKLELKLKVGDRFPLMKSVSHALDQLSVVGAEQSRSHLELLLIITVEDVRPEKKLLSVRYNRVRYWQDVAGEAFDFDSSSVGGPVPKAALPYKGLVGNGFSFWLGPDNQVLEPVGFDKFLERCVRDVPVEERQRVLSQFTQTTADEGIANFVDDSIGLLPYAIDGRERGKVAEGDTWSRERRLMQPVPVYLKNRYTLRSLTDATAEIDILGTVSPASTDQPSPGGVVPASAEADANPSPTPQVLVRGGNAAGSCTIDRATGLPLRSNVDRMLNMTVRLPNGLEFSQRKRTTTTIQAFPQQPPPATAAGPKNEKR